MAAGTRYDIVLTPAQTRTLHAIAVARRRPVRQVRNAQLLLQRAERVPVRQIAGTLHCSTATIAGVCRRFLAEGWPDCCREAARGRPPGYPAAVRADACAWVQTSPQQLGLPRTRWSLSAAQTCWCVHRAPPAPARSTFRRWFKAAALPWWQIHTGCTSTDPDFALKGAAVCDAYRHAPACWGLCCYDQKPHIQALSRRVPVRYARSGQAGRQEHDYKRQGVVEVHALLDVRTGACQWALRDNHRQETIAELLFGWLNARPERQFLLVMDNLASNHAPAVQAAYTQLGKLVVVLKIPTYSSWLNQVERVFADLQTQLLDYADARSVADLGAQIDAWFAARNPTTRPFNWTLESDSAMFATAH